MMLDQVKIALAGFERLVPRALLKANQSFGWQEVQGANPVVEKVEKPKTSRTTAKNKRESKDA